MRWFCRTLFVAALCGPACEGKNKPSLPTAVMVSPFWENTADDSPGAALHIEVGLDTNFSAQDSCATLSKSVFITANGRPATIAHPGGEATGGSRCFYYAVATVPAFPVAELAELIVRVQDGDDVGTAVFGNVIANPPFVSAGTQLKIGTDVELALRNGLDNYVVETRQVGQPVLEELADFNGQKLLFRTRGTPGPATLTLRQGAPRYGDEDPATVVSCTGLRSCSSKRVFVAGPVAVELVP